MAKYAPPTPDSNPEIAYSTHLFFTNSPAPHMSGSDLEIAKSHMSNRSSAELQIADLIRERRPWYRVPHLLRLAFVIFALTLSCTTTGYDGSVINSLQSLDHWQTAMGHPSGARLGHLSNGVIFGSIAGVFVAPYLCDRFGRKWIVILGSVIAVVGAIMQGLAPGYNLFLVSRLVIGVGACFSAVSAPVLISEIAYPTHREASTFAYNVCWYLGAIIASWVSYGTRLIYSDYQWKIPSYLQGALPFLQICCFYMIPESPRFLVKKGQNDKAEQILKELHVGGSEHPQDLALIRFELSEIEAAISIEKHLSDISYADFIRNKRFRKRLFLLVFVGVMMQLSGNQLVSTYLVQVLESIGITTTKEQLQINGCLMIYNLVISLCLTNLVTRFRRRTMFLTGFVGMLVSYIVWTILSALAKENNFENRSLSQGVLAFIFFYYLFYNTALNGMPYLYLTEILPYSHRAKGINIFVFVLYVVLVYNGYVNTIAMSAISWRYYIVYCCILAVELIVVYFFFPETSGYTLEEVGRVFGDDAPEIDVREVEAEIADETGRNTRKER